MQLPAVVLQIEASKVLADPELISLVGQALQGGCNMVVLRDSTSNAAAMYDAALRVQEVLRGRAALVLVDRTDIALAINAQGVLLTDQGGQLPCASTAMLSKTACSVLLKGCPEGLTPGRQVMWARDWFRAGAAAQQLYGRARLQRQRVPDPSPPAPTTHTTTASTIGYKNYTRQRASTHACHVRPAAQRSRVGLLLPCCTPR